jgi:hypothetical protein
LETCGCHRGSLCDEGVRQRTHRDTIRLRLRDLNAAGRADLPALRHDATTD